MKLFTAALWLAAGVSSVTITAHRQRQIGGSPCHVPAVLQCNNVPPRNCCGVVRPGEPFRAMLFTGLDTTGVPEQATVFRTGQNTPCGQSCNSDGGHNNLCVSCSQTNPEIAGGFYFRPGRRRDEEGLEGANCTTVLPDIAFIEGHRFSVYHGVPNDISDRIVDLALDEARYDDVSADLLEYEISDEASVEADHLYNRQINEVNAKSESPQNTAIESFAVKAVAPQPQGTSRGTFTSFASSSSKRLPGAREQRNLRTMDSNSGCEFNVHNINVEVDDSPIFTLERVRFHFPFTPEFVAAQVANKVIILALSDKRILRINYVLRPREIEDIELPKTTAGGATIRRMFLDPTASHLFICASNGDNYYLHSHSRQPHLLGKLHHISLESIAWNPALPTASTGEILLGASDGRIYETLIGSSIGSRKGSPKDVKYLKVIQHIHYGPITGLWLDSPEGRLGVRRLMIATPSRLTHVTGRTIDEREGIVGIYAGLFESNRSEHHEVCFTAEGQSSLVVSPAPQDMSLYNRNGYERTFAWLTSQGVFQGKLLNSREDSGMGSNPFSESKMLTKTQIVTPEPSARFEDSSEVIEAIALTQWHILSLVGGWVIITNRLTSQMISKHQVSDERQRLSGLAVDHMHNTFWVYTSKEIFEIVIQDEERVIWRIMMGLQRFEPALQLARTRTQRETVAAAYGDHLFGQGRWNEAAVLYGRSNKAFESLALEMIDKNQTDALRLFLMSRLAATDKRATTQRTMLATWIVELLIAKLNTLEDIANGSAQSNPLRHRDLQDLLNSVQKEYQEFINDFKNDLDKKTAYDIMDSHGRERELLFFADAVNDYEYIMAYFMQREQWSGALDVMEKQIDPNIFYLYSSVLMNHAPERMVDIWMKNTHLESRKLIPALLGYNTTYSGGVNQAIRYLSYVVYQLQSEDSVVHNTLVSLHASQPAEDELSLLSYLESQGNRPKYDLDFAFRLCDQHRRTLSCVYIYTILARYRDALDIALSHDELELAAEVADQPKNQPQLRKQLWLVVAQKVISQSGDASVAVNLLGRCELLTIEDLLPLLPDFVAIDAFKEEICNTLEDYCRGIDRLAREMDESARSVTHIKRKIAALDHRYAIVEPGDKCCACGLPLLSRLFFAFSCQHAFHADCLTELVLEQVGADEAKRIRHLQLQASMDAHNSKREAIVAELDSLVASACILCSDFAIRNIDEPFITKGDKPEEWML
ncbi:Vacuolar protein sorting-associated protein-like protein [Paramyrothecium foliicola]|nr:Vacuolar protein sorting-associated protein-like protein [Paramyrothecium foliicola]